MDNNDEHLPQIERPSLFWFLTEGSRAITELGFSLPYRKLYGYDEQGDGHPVLVLPGFMTTDFSTAPLRRFIDDLGYTSYNWGLGLNTANIRFLDILHDRLESIYESHGEQVSLIGWSLGGVFARQLAKRNPEMVRQIITMGSPFKGIHRPNNVAWIYNMLTHRKSIKEIAPELFEDIPLPAPVPTTAIYTKEDGIVPWQLCMEDEDDIHQNIRVRGSHFGLGINPSVYEIIADRLWYTSEDWEHFRARSFVQNLLFYPSLA